MAEVRAVIDASALLAVLNDEPGGSAVVPLLSAAAMSTVNWSEVAQKALQHGVASSPGDLRGDVEALGLQLHPFSASQAETAATLWATTRRAGLSLGDRACLALAIELGAPAVTADATWQGLSLAVDVRVVR